MALAKQLLAEHCAAELLALRCCVRCVSRIFLLHVHFYGLPAQLLCDTETSLRKMNAIRFRRKRIFQVLVLSFQAPSRVSESFSCFRGVQDLFKMTCRLVRLEELENAMKPGAFRVSCACRLCEPSPLSDRTAS